MNNHLLLHCSAATIDTRSIEMKAQQTKEILPGDYELIRRGKSQLECDICRDKTTNYIRCANWDDCENFAVICRACLNKFRNETIGQEYIPELQLCAHCAKWYCGTAAATKMSCCDANALSFSMKAPVSRRSVRKYTVKKPNANETISKRAPPVVIRSVSHT